MLLGSVDELSAHPALINRKYPECNLSILPMHIVYPFPWWNDAARFGHTGWQIWERYEVHHEAIGIHWYAGSKEAQRYNGKLNEDNYTSYDNTICRYARLTA